MEYVFELCDITSDEAYYEVGIFSEFDKAKKKLDDADDPECLTDVYIDDYAEFEIRRRKLNAGNGHKSLLVVTFRKEYKEDSDEYTWEKEYQEFPAC